MAKSNRISIDTYRRQKATGRKRVQSDGRFSEHKSQCAFFDYINANCGKYPHWRTIAAIANGARTSMTVAVRLKREGLRAGFPDIIAPFARNRYHGLMIEMKTPANSPSQVQQDMIALLIANGYAVVVCKSTDAAILTLNMYEAGESLDELLYVKGKRMKK